MNMQLQEDALNPYIREATAEDKIAIKEYISHSLSPLDYVTFGDLEWFNAMEKGDSIFEAYRNKWGNHILLAFLDDMLIGMSIVTSQKSDKFRHVGELTLSISQAHWHKGVGKDLITNMILLCKEKGTIRKLNLRVREDQDYCKQLYKSLGFYEEGNLSRDICVNGMFYSSLLFGRNID
jgi:L-amino acid N-acyltransferase YncA